MNSSVKSNIDFLKLESFHQRIREEKKRAERTNAHFTLIIIDLSFLNKPATEGVKCEEIPLDTIFDIIYTNTREIDLKGWYDSSKIGILLPGTSYLGAIILSIKLINLIKEHLHHQVHHTTQFENYFSIIPYPDFSYDDEASQEKLHENGNKIATSSKKKIGEFIQRYKIHFDNSERLLLSSFPKLNYFSFSYYLQKIIKRFFDIICSLLGIVMLLPIFIIIAIAIKLTSPGPVFFKQKRVGLYGKPFICLKLRTMFNNCDQTIHREHIHKLSKGEVTFFKTHLSNIMSYKLQQDTRVTNIGKFLRATNIDEYPQLFNVLKGEMSIVGPRPYTTYQIEHCQLWQHFRHTVKPGITGLAQLQARFNSTFKDAYMLDIQYVKEYSLWLDFKIFIKTIPFLFSCRGAI